MTEDKALRFDQGKIRWDLLPISTIEEVIKVYMYGLEKYKEGGKDNWLKGMEYSRVFNSGTRHRMAFWKGEDNDKESGLSHLSHSIWNDLTLLTYQMKGMSKFDDRVKII